MKLENMLSASRSTYIDSELSDLATARTGSPLPLPTGSFIGVIAAIFAVCVIATVNFISLRRNAEGADRVVHTNEVVRSITSILSALKDTEIGQRGFILTGRESYLEPYDSGRANLQSAITRARQLVDDNAAQLRRLDQIEHLSQQKLTELSETIQLMRAGSSKAAADMVLTDRGKGLMDRIRTLIGQIQDEERSLLAQRQEDWRDTQKYSTLVVWLGALGLLVLIIASGVTNSRDFRRKEREAWLRAALAGFTLRLQGDQPLDRLGQNAMDYLCRALDAPVGVAYLPWGDGRFKRFGAHALAEGDTAQEFHSGGLIAQVAQDGTARRVSELPPGYLHVASGIGLATVNELIVMPAAIDGEMQAVIELGFFRKLTNTDLELVQRVSQALGMAVRSAQDRTRLEELLEETQRQAEELQTQQEELRVSNEELEEQSNLLRESQAQLETQQAELEQTNSQLEEQAQTLEHQRDELELAQSVLGQKAQELERSNQYKSEFLANMSHELRTPLNSTLILAGLLADNKEGNLSEEQIKFARTISDAGNDLLNLINDILDLAKIEAGKVELLLEPTRVTDVCESLVRSLRPLAEQKGLALQLTVEAGTPQALHTDSQRLSQILKNLLSNAIKFTERGEVILSVRSDSKGISFVVRDSGIGIAEHQFDIIFEAFRQADGSTHRKYGGTGLGLSISRDLARLLGGDLQVRSRPGEGSEFTLTLPVGSSDMAVAPGAQTASPPAPSVPVRPIAAINPTPTPRRLIDDDRDALQLGGRLILVIEDDARFAEILRDMVREMGMQCMVCGTAAEGLAAAAHHRPSAIVLDVNLPDESGITVLDRLKRNPQTRHIPVHVASVADHAQQVLERGAVGYALKPVKREELTAALHRLEKKFSQEMRYVLVVEDDERQRDSICELLASQDVKITAVASATEALQALGSTTFDVMVMDLNLPDLSGYDLLQCMSEREEFSFPPVIVYTGRSLTREEEQRLRRYSKSIIIKDARSPERLLDEVTLFLHQVETNLPARMQHMLRSVRARDDALEGRRILVVEDDVRNVFALCSVLEPKGAKVEIARNGREAIEALDRSANDDDKRIDLVLMDIMMPEMDGLSAMRAIRQRVAFKRLPIIALTAKAMRDDQEKCIAAGANDYIAKPLDVEKLLSLVRVWMPK